MKDQVDGKANGVQLVSSTVANEAELSCIQDLTNGTTKIVYVAPETYPISILFLLFS
jgi:superfamily II DNA helicase RecQ